MNTTATIASVIRRTDSGRTSARRRLGFAFLVAALVSATACGSDATINGVSSPTTSAPTHAAPTTTSTIATSTTMSTTAVVAPTTAVITIARSTAKIDQLVGADGKRVHVRCVGQGGTTVVLIAGFGGDSTNWVKVEPDLAARARVCSYDRPGTGTSDPATTTATFATEATDLHTLLSAIGEPGPYILVGHSFGGAEAVTFASLFAADVTGLVLIDASPATWPAALCATPDDGSGAAATVLGTCAGAFPPARNSEHLDVVTAFAEVSTVGSLGSLPMAVITATHRELPAGLAAEEVARLTDAWNRGQDDWAKLSTAAHLVSVDHTGHHIEIDQPQVVIDEITRLFP